MVVSPHSHKCWASYEKTYVNAHFIVVTNGHNESQRITNRHKRAPGPNASASWRSQEVKIAPGPSASASWRSQMVAISHQAPVPAHPGGHKWSQNRTRPQIQRLLAVTGGSQNHTRPQCQRILVVTQEREIESNLPARTRDLQNC